MRLSRGIVLIALVALLSGLGVGAYYVFRSSDSSNPVVHVTPGPKTLAPANLTTLKEGLNSRDKKTQGLALTPTLRKGRWSSGKLMPVGAKATIDANTFVVESLVSAHVTATVTGSVKAVFVLHLTSVDGGPWLIDSTRRVK